MKVIVVEDFAEINGGATKVAILGAIGCARAGIPVHYVAACGPVAPELEGVSGLEVTCLGQYDIKSDPNRLRAATSGIANYRAASTLEKIIKASPRDTVVHFHSWIKALSPTVVKVAARSGLPTVMSLHDYFTACPNGGFFNYQSNQLCQLTPLSASCVTCNCDARSYTHKVWRTVRSVIQRQVFDVPGCLKHFILLSPLARKLQEPYLPRNAAFYMLENPIAVPNLGRTPAEENESILFVGRLSPEKGVMSLAKALRDLNMSAVFVGDGDLKRDLMNMLPQAEFTGWLKGELASAKYRAARAVVFPSIWHEVLPLVPMEAAANGVPVVLSDCTAACDYLPHGQRGLHFEANNVESLKSQLVAIRDGTLVERLSKNVYEWYWNNPWTLDRYVSKLVGIYEKMAESEMKANSSEERI